MSREWNEPWVCVNWYTYEDDNEDIREGWCLSFKNKGDEKATIEGNYDTEFGMVNEHVLTMLALFANDGYEVHMVL